MKRSIIITKLRPIGGAQRVAVQQAKVFNLEKIYYISLKRDKLDGINFIPIFFISSILNLVKSDQIYTHSTFAGWFGRLFTFVPFKSITIYHTFHGFNALKMPLGGVYLFLERIYAFLQFKAIFVCQSDYELAQKKRIVLHQQKKVIYNSSKNYDGLEKTELKQKSVIRVLSLARCADQKDFKTLVNALNVTTNSSIVVDNYGGGDVVEYQRLYGSDKLNFLGEIEDVGSIINDYNIGILISNYEGMPISLLEMLSAGLQLIATDVGGVSEIITSEVEGYLVNKQGVGDLTRIFDSITNENDVKSHKNKEVWNKLFSPTNYNELLLNYGKE